MKFIELLNGENAVVDNDDYEFLKQFTWYFHTHGYTSTWIKGKTVLMHRLIMKPRKGFVIDHINGNKLDNRKINLRICNQSQNLANIIKSKNRTSIYKGVNFDKSRNNWVAKIRINKKSVALGRFNNELHAAMAYHIWAKDHFGKFARTNFTTMS